MVTSTHTHLAQKERCVASFTIRLGIVSHVTLDITCWKLDWTGPLGRDVAHVLRTTCEGLLSLRSFVACPVDASHWPMLRGAGGAGIELIVTIDVACDTPQTRAHRRRGHLTGGREQRKIRRCRRP